METEFRNKDKILAESIFKNTIHHYESLIEFFKKEKYYVLNIRNIGLVLKQVELKRDEVILKSLNPDYPNRPIDKEDVLDAWIVIKIIERNFVN